MTCRRAALYGVPNKSTELKGRGSFKKELHDKEVVSNESKTFR